MWIKFTLAMIAAVMAIAFFIQTEWIRWSMAILIYIIVVASCIKESINNAIIKDEDNE